MEKSNQKKPMNTQQKTILICLILVGLFALSLYAYDKVSDDKEKNEIVEFLNKFQMGYSKRDLSMVKEWADEIMTKDVYILGTNAVYPNTGEWQVGIDKAYRLFSNDWKRWGVLNTDIKNADIRILNKDVALVAMTATVTKSVENGFARGNEKNIERCLKRLASLETDMTKSNRLKLFTAIWDAGTVLKNIELGETMIWPIRISMVLVKLDGRWKMNQTHFSYPGSGYPQVRIVDGKVVGY